MQSCRYLASVIFVLSLSITLFAAPSPEPSPLAMHSASPLPTDAPSGTPSDIPNPGVTIKDPEEQKISAAEVRKIRRDFIEVLEREREALRRDQKRARRDGDAGRKARKSDWLANETAARRQFFAENIHGPERRTYVQDFNRRRVQFFETLKNEEKIQVSDLEARWKSLEEDQRMRLAQVESFLKRRERPPVALLQGP